MAQGLASLTLALGLGLIVALPSGSAQAATYSRAALTAKDRDRVCIVIDGRKWCFKDGKHWWDRDAPEAPFAVGLPISGLAVFGAYVLRQRRRRDVADEPDGPDGIVVA